jgi:hypothetical protein
MVLYGERYERPIRKDGKPLSPKQERAEREKLDKETNKRKQEPAEAKAKRLETERQKSLVCNAEFVDGSSSARWEWRASTGVRPGRWKPAPPPANRRSARG